MRKLEEHEKFALITRQWIRLNPDPGTKRSLIRTFIADLLWGAKVNEVFESKEDDQEYA